MKHLLLYTLVLLIGCDSFRTSNKATNRLTQIDNQKSSMDTLRNPTHFYYLSDLPLRKVAASILLDSIEVSDNKITFDCLDSVIAKSPDTRDFYFPVFLKIMDKSDGALSEALGQYAIKYVEQFTEEFSKRLTSLNDNQFNQWAGSVGYELSFAEIEEADTWTSGLIKKCKRCDSVQLNRLKLFNEKVVVSMQEASEN